MPAVENVEAGAEDQANHVNHTLGDGAPITVQPQDGDATPAPGTLQHTSLLYRGKAESLFHDYQLCI